MRGQRFALPKDLSTIATVWWERRLPDLDGVASAEWSISQSVSLSAEVIFELMN